MTTAHTIKFFFILCPFIALASAAQNFPELRFTHLTTKDGLSSNNISCIFKDRRGFMWIGTDNGLNCYDGRRVKIYQHNSADSNSLPDNTIKYIIAGRENNFWISTRFGLASFDPLTGKCKNYFHKEGNSNSLGHNETPAPLIDSKGRLWLATLDGVQLFDPIKNIFTTIRMPVAETQEQKKFYNNKFQTIFEDSDHHLWTTNLSGLYEIDQQKFILTSYSTGYSGLSLFGDHFRQIWIGQFAGGFMQFDPVKKKFTHHHFSDRSVYALHEWNLNKPDNWLCMGTDVGLFLYNKLNDQYKQYSPDNNNEYSLRGDIVNCFYKDEMNRLWVGTNKGLNILDPNLQHFQNYPLNKTAVQRPVDESGLARCMFEEDNEYSVGVWYQKGLYRFDKNWNFIRQEFPIPAGKTGGYIKTVYNIYKDPDNNYWYSTDSGIIKRALNKFIIYIPPDGESAERGDFELREILPRNDGLFWIRAKRSGIYVFDKTSGLFLNHYRYKKDKKNCLPECIMNVIRYDKKNRLWVCTEKGLYRYNETTDDFTSFYFTYMNKQDEILLNRIKDVAGDNNYLWVATEKGFIKLDTETGKYEILDKSLGLVEEKIGRILVDKTGIVWMTTKKGLVSYNDSKKTFRLFNATFGVPVENFNSDAVFTFNSKGNIIMGGDNTVTEFDPYTLSSITAPPPVEIAEVKILGETVVYKTIGEHQKQVNLSAGIHQLSVQFSVLNYTSPLQNKFYYKLEGINKDWVQSDDGSIDFTNLQAGKYELSVKGANNDGTMNETGDKLIIIIAPYFWQTWWFQLSAVLLGTAFIYWLLRRRIKLIRHEAMMKQKIAETEMMALRAQMNPHFIFNCINSIDAMIQSNDKYHATMYLNKFAKLIRNILDSSKQNLVPLSKDIETLQLYVDLEMFRHRNKFKAEINADPQLMDYDYQVPPLIIQPYVENAILHGLRYRTDNDGKLTVNINKQNGSLNYEITDNGVGRSSVTKKKDNESKSIKTNGYGMQISGDRVRIFNNEEVASVQVTDLTDNDKPAGTKVTLQLKIQ